jgi:hypothetical protein
VNREQLLAARPRLVQSVEITGVGQVNLRILTGREALDLEVGLRKADRDSAEGVASLVAAQIAAFVSDESGKPILSVDDAATLVRQLSAGQVRQIVAEGAKLNALGAASVEEAGGN